MKQPLRFLRLGIVSRAVYMICFAFLVNVADSWTMPTSNNHHLWLSHSLVAGIRLENTCFSARVQL